MIRDATIESAILSLYGQNAIPARGGIIKAKNRRGSSHGTI
jgi:hypothetical protein